MKLLITHLFSLGFLACSFSALGQTSYNYYFGNLHSHTGFSDGSKDSLTSGISTPYQSYTYAKASLHFDFLGISEHNHASAGMQKANYQLGFQQADSANEDGQFVAMFGMEWGTISTGGHVLIYGCNELLGWETNNYDEHVAKGDYLSLWAKINDRPGAFGMCAHPATSDFSNLRMGAFNNAANKALVGTVFRSGPAFSTNILYSNPSGSSYENYYRGLLARGYHVGPTYDHDNHNTTFGRTTEGRLVALAPALTRADLMHAFRNRAFYASDDWNAEVMITLNTQHIMGAIVEDAGAPTIQVTLADADGETNSSFELLKGTPGSGQPATAAASATGGAMAISFTDAALQPGDSAYYYVTITQADGDKIITAPVWYTRTGLVGTPDDLSAATNIQVWPNPVSATSQPFVTITTPAAGEITVLDLLGRVVQATTAIDMDTTMPTNKLAPGMYVIVFTANQAAPITKRLVVE